MIFDNLLGYVLSISMRMQNFIKIFQTVEELSTFFDIFHEYAGVKIFTNCPMTNQMFDYRALYEIQLQISVDFLRVVQLDSSMRKWLMHQCLCYFDQY